RYFGGKQKLAPHIINLLPKSGRKFIDLFCGRANIVLCAMQQGFQYDEWVLNDIRTFNFLRAIIHHGDKILVPAITDKEFKRPEALNQNDPEKLLLAAFFTFNGVGFGNGGSSKEGGRRTQESYQNNLRAAHKLLKERNVTISKFDWYDCL